MEISDSTLELCLNYIESGKCILFLGPKFAMDEKGDIVNEKIKEDLSSAAFQDKLDFTYNNIYIFKQNNPSAAEKMQLNLALKKAYGKITPHPIYEKLATIPFQAIFVASPDRFLYNAYQNQSLDVVFQYYSRKGGGESNLKVDPSIPIIYNIFGDLEDEGSLMNTVKDFYKFLISILGEEHQLPLELRNRIAHTQIFVFLGFDLTRWYLPLLIQKLNSFKDEQENATALVNKDSKKNVDADWYFPIEVIVSEQETIPMIDILHKNLHEKGALNTPGTQKEVNKIDAFKTMVSDGKFQEVFSGLKAYSQNIGKSKDDVIMVEVRHVELLNQQNLGTISEADKKLELAQITQATLGLINEFFEE